MQIEPIAYYYTILKGKFGLPRQSGLAESLRGKIVLAPGYRSEDALRGLEEFDYLWLIWAFNQNSQSSGFEATVRPPRLGGNKRVGVFASRSPFRPNGLGLSSLKILSVNPKDFTIEVCGGDLADGTPIFDIKPYIEYADSHSGIRSGFVDKVLWQTLEVGFSDEVKALYSTEDLAALSEILSNDPRPQYQKDPNRIYKLRFGSSDLSFNVCENSLFCFLES